MNIKQKIMQFVAKRHPELVFLAVLAAVCIASDQSRLFTAHFQQQTRIEAPSRRSLDRPALQRRSSRSSRSLHTAILQRTIVAAPTLLPGEDAKPVVVRKPPTLIVQAQRSTPGSSSAASSLLSASSRTSVPPVIAASSSSAASTEQVRPAAPERQEFPAFGRTLFPVGKTPNWGAMRSPSVWNRTYSEMTAEDFVPVPAYDMRVLLQPMKELTKSPIPDANIPAITAKLFYSTKYFGAYDLDAIEFSAVHPGLDLKLAEGTPIAAIGGGRVHGVRNSPSLGLHVLIEHRLRNGEIFYSIYGHLASVSVSEGQDIRPGQVVGRIGMTGNTSGPHLHLQIDRKRGDGPHAVYYPPSVPSRSEAESWAVHPVRFIERYAAGE